jgi:hypothetical protein
LDSLRQNAISSAITATAVRPRIVRKLAGTTSMSAPVDNAMLSAVSPVTSSFNTGTCAKMPRT